MKMQNLFLFVFLFIVTSLNINAQTQINQTIIGDEPNHFFGYSVAINASGSIIIASSPFASNMGERWGEAKVYINNNNDWELIFEIKGEADYDELGSGVAINHDGNTIAVSLDKMDYPGIFGEIKIYERNENTYLQKANTIVSTESQSAFGRKLVLSDDGNILVSGAYLSKANGGGSGQVKVFQFNSGNNTWEQFGNNINGNPGDFFGYSIDYSDNGTSKRIVVGSPLTENETGQTKVYQLNGNTWEQIGQSISGFSIYSKSGTAVAISASGNRIVVGEPFPSGYKPQVRVFDYNTLTNQWEQLGNILVAEEYGDAFGNAVSLSDDGLLMTIGAYNANSQFGRTYIYKFNTTLQLWELSGIPLQGQSNEWGEFGKSVAMSNDGSTVIASEPRYNYNNGFDFGAVMVYNTDPVLGVEDEIYISSDILISPNPILSTATLNIGKEILQSIKIFNIEGKLLNEIEYRNIGDSKIDFSNYKSGIYILKITTKNGTLVKRVLKE